MTGFRRSRLATGIIVVAVLGALAAAGGLAYLFLRGAPPPAVVLGSEDPGATGVAGTIAPVPSGAVATAAVDSLDGTWTVDPSIGSFDDFTSSFVGYRVNETFNDNRANTAVGRTPSVSGTLVVAGTAIIGVSVTADLTGLRSDDERRDGQLRQQAIETGAFPTATFRLTSPIELGALPEDGGIVRATGTGELTLHGVPRTVEVPIQAQLAGDVVTVIGSIEILFADYAIERPRSFLVLSIEDHATIELQLHFRRG
jgi:polyisoprenoid-binding protein YceI